MVSIIRAENWIEVALKDESTIRWMIVLPLSQYIVWQVIQSGHEAGAYSGVN